MTKGVASNANYGGAIRYLCVGATANILGLVVFQSLALYGLSPEISSFLSFFPAFITAYILNKVWSFQSNISHSRALFRYALATLACVGLQVLIVSILTRALVIYPLLAQMIALAIAVPISYLLLKLWVFKPAKPQAVY